MLGVFYFYRFVFCKCFLELFLYLDVKMKKRLLVRIGNKYFSNEYFKM